MSCYYPTNRGPSQPEQSRSSACYCCYYPTNRGPSQLRVVCRTALLAVTTPQIEVHHSINFNERIGQWAVTTPQIEVHHSGCILTYLLTNDYLLIHIPKNTYRCFSFRLDNHFFSSSINSFALSKEVPTGICPCRASFLASLSLDTFS